MSYANYDTSYDTIAILWAQLGIIRGVNGLDLHCY